MNITSKELGKIGEDLAAELLTKAGYKILERNYTFGKGEIDIIAIDPDTDYTAFIEVKTRSNLEYGDPVLGITKNKMSQIRKMTEAYLYSKNITEISCRFDVITVLFLDEKKPVIQHYINAFS
jgi:putative endonuclease